MMTATAAHEDNARRQAIAQLESIKEMVEALEKAEEDGTEDDREEARERIQEDALSVEVRSDWHTPGNATDSKPTEYRILLCTGGPAVQIRGELNHCMEPETAKIEHQDWFTPWTEYYPAEDEDREALLTYARQFYFGE